MSSRAWRLGAGLFSLNERAVGEYECVTLWASSAPLRDLLHAPTALAASCGFDLCHKNILYLYLYLYLWEPVCAAPT